MLGPVTAQFSDLTDARSARADAGPADVPLIAHVDAGDPSPFTGDELNTAAERNLLAASGADAGAVAVPDTSCASTIASVATFLAGVGLGVYLHQRAMH